MSKNYNKAAAEFLKLNLVEIIPKKFKEDGITSFSDLDLNEALATLSQKENQRDYEIITKRYGLFRKKQIFFKKEQTLGKIGDKYNLSRERIRQLEEEILKQLCTDLTRKKWKKKYGDKNPELPIEISELSHRVKNVLSFENIQTIEELSLLNKKEILKYQNIGLSSLKEIEEYLLNQFGIKL